MKLFTTSLVLLLLSPFMVAAATNDFPRSLSVGMKGEDVRLLQQVLNMSAETRIASTGAGSPGNETDYFGMATKRALVVFQEKYRAEVLTPANLTAGTGFFGALSRVKMAAMVSQRSAAASSAKPNPVSALTLTAKENEVIVMNPSQYSGKSGTMISVSGAGFTATGNTVHFGDAYAVENVVSKSGSTVSFKVPSIPKGAYTLFVSNTRNVSNKDAFFVVTDGVTPEPKVDRATPSHVKRGGVVTIYGSGFTKTDNIVRTGVSLIEHVSSLDGTSLSFTIPANLFNSTTTSPTKALSLPVWGYVVNENGVSNGVSFTLEL